MSASFTSRSWERVGVVVFELHGKIYIVTVDYDSRWVKADQFDIRVHRWNAEWAVKILRNILKKNKDPHLALLIQCTTLLLKRLSLIKSATDGTHVRTRLPSILLPGVTGRVLPKVMEREAVQREKQQQQFNNPHRAKDLTTLQPGDNVWVRDQGRYGIVVERAPQPRLYLIHMENGVIMRYRYTEIRQQVQCNHPTHTLTSPA